MTTDCSTTQIHPTAVVDAKAELAPGVVIGPGAVVGPEVSIGPNSWIGPNVVLDGRLSLGRDNRVSRGLASAWNRRTSNTEVLRRRW